VTVEIDGARLTLDELLAVSRHGAGVRIAPAAARRRRSTRAVVERAVAAGAEAYGVTTGVGVRKRVRMDEAQLESFNRRLILDHLVAVGPPVADEVVRATLLRLANGFAKGTAGVRLELAELVVEALNDDRLPRVRSLGSPGQSDLAPMADLAHGLIGGFALQAREGLALINNSSFSTALAALALADALRLLDAVTVVSALELEGLAGNVAALHPEVARTRPYPGIARAIADLHAVLECSYLWQPRAARNLQDPLSFRNLAQILGAAQDALGFARAQLAIELNASQENPLLIASEGRMVSVGNFEMLPLSAALDVARIGLAPVLTSANERMVKLLQAPHTGLTDGLQPHEVEHENALSEFAWTGQALAPEARLLAQPVSIEVASSSQAEGVEDRVSMAPLAARRTAEMVGLGEHLLSVSVLVACQAVELRGSRPLGAGTGRLFCMVRERMPFVGAGDVVPPDLEPLRALIRSGQVSVGALTPDGEGGRRA